MKIRGGEVREPRDVHCMEKEWLGDEWWEVWSSMVVSVTEDCEEMTAVAVMVCGMCAIRCEAFGMKLC
jgi:hypothetical protein